ncbi:MAG: hypothetical protein AB1480_18530, partial [Nitrospirota bacterium]
MMLLHREHHGFSLPGMIWEYGLLMLHLIRCKQNSQPNEDAVIYVVVDPDNAIEEMDKSNNIASILLMRTIPDLSITQSDITIIPPDTIEGQPASIKAIIHNIAPSTGSGLGASDVVVSFYDGDPQSGGTLIGSITKSYIDSGATALAEIQWDTFGQSGR